MKFYVMLQPIPLRTYPPPTFKISQENIFWCSNVVNCVLIDIPLFYFILNAYLKGMTKWDAFECVRGLHHKIEINEYMYIKQTNTFQYKKLYILRAITLLDTLSVLFSERSLFISIFSDLFAVQKTRQAATDRSQ